MKAAAAIAVLLVACALIAVLLVLKVLTTIVAGLAFALALVVLGIASRGFRR